MLNPPLVPELIPVQADSLEYVPLEPETESEVPPTEMTFGELAGHCTPLEVPLSPAAATKVMPVWPDGVVKSGSYCN